MYHFLIKCGIDTTKEEIMVNNKKWWMEEVIYEIYPQSFNDTNDDGIGDINGISEKLDYLHELGITSIWICPVFKSPLIDNGYDISDYQSINQIFGDNNDLYNLIEKAKTYNIKILLDLVINHTSDEHPWFKEALTNKESKYRDYYIFKSGDDNTPPNNWRSIFGGSAWEPVPGEEETYYLHTFHSKQPDLNWENPHLRQEIYDMINWWIEKGVYGFRIDSITFIKKDQDYASLPADGADNLSNIKNKTRNRPGISTLLSELNEQTFNKYDVVTVGEAPGVSYDEFDEYIGKNGYFNMIFDFKYADIDVENGSEWFRKTDWTYDEYIEKIKVSQETLQKYGWGANFIENHDQPRALSKLIQDPQFKNDLGAKALAISYFFLRGTPFIYQGQELGLDNVNWTEISTYNDISSHDNYDRALLEWYSTQEAISFVQDRSRDNGRIPFPWTNEQYGGFSKKEPWLSMKEEYPEINAANNSVLNFYKEMIHLRQNTIYKNTLIYGDIHFKDDTPSSVMAYTRSDDTNRLLVITNFNSNVQTIEIPSGDFKVLLNTHETLKNEKNKIFLEPMQALVVDLGGRKK